MLYTHNKRTNEIVIVDSTDHEYTYYHVVRSQTAWRGESVNPEDYPLRVLDSTTFHRVFSPYTVDHSHDIDD